VGLIPWLTIGLNIIGMVVMLKWGFPREVPWVGREDGDPLLGFVGLVIYGTSIGIRVMLSVAG